MKFKYYNLILEKSLVLAACILLTIDLILYAIFDLSTMTS